MLPAPSKGTANHRPQCSLLPTFQTSPYLPTSTSEAVALHWNTASFWLQLDFHQPSHALCSLPLPTSRLHLGAHLTSSTARLSASPLQVDLDLLADCRPDYMPVIRHRRTAPTRTPSPQLPCRALTLALALSLSSSSARIRYAAPRQAKSLPSNSFVPGTWIQAPPLHAG